MAPKQPSEGAIACSIAHIACYILCIRTRDYQLEMPQLIYLLDELDRKVLAGLPPPVTRSFFAPKYAEFPERQAVYDSTVSKVFVCATVRCLALAHRTPAVPTAPAGGTSRVARLRPAEVAEQVIRLVPGLCRHLEKHHGHLQSMVRRAPLALNGTGASGL